MISENKAIIGHRIVLTGLAVILAGCSTLMGSVSDDGIDYKSTVKQQSLEIPPDLTTPATNRAMDVADPANQANTYSAYLDQQLSSGQQTEGSRALPEQSGIRYEHEGPNAWLVLKGTKEQIWPRIREFWLKTGFVLVEDKPELGIMETEWAENRANIPKGTIRNLLSKVFAAAYTSGTRDKFRVRVEEVPEKETLELFITHRGMVERVVGGDLSSEGSVWEVRPSDPDLEATMLKRLMVQLGVPKSQASSVLASAEKQQANAQLQMDGERASVVLLKDFSRAWRLVGLALDRVSFTVVDRNRSKGIYYVKYSDPDRTNKDSGILSKLKFWSDKKPGEEESYQVTLLDENESVRVVVNNANGEPETSSTGERILKLLFEQLK
jgi:outer membrane protein assembly factor BamC